MARTRQELILEFRKIRTQLRNTDCEKLREACLDGIDALLDERLVQKEAHPADCGCWECERHIYEVMSRRCMGENLHPEDLAADGW